MPPMFLTLLIHKSLILENTIQGNDAILELNQGGVYTPFVCVKSFTLEQDSELVETTTLSTGKYRDYELQSLDYTITLSTLLVINSTNANGKFAFEQQQVGSKFAYRITFTDSAANTYQITGILIVKNSLFSVTAGQLVTGDFTLKGCGSFYTINGSTEIPGAELFAGLYTATGGEDSFIDADLIGASLAHVMRNGIGVMILTSGVPGTNQVLFDSVTGEISVGAGMEFGAGEYIQYIFSV